MGSKIARTLIEDTKKITQDLKGRFWEDDETLGWLNAGQLEVCIHRPDAYSVLETHVCEGQVTQSIPAHGLRFLEATYNLATGYVIQPMARKALDEVQRTWQSNASPVSEVEHYIFDERFPKYFKLFPAPSAGTLIEIGFSAAPEPCLIDEAIKIDDIYANALMDYMLARMYLKNTTLTNAAQKSQQHYQLFYQSLGVKFQADLAMSPNNPENKAD